MNRIILTFTAVVIATGYAWGADLATYRGIYEKKMEAIVLEHGTKMTDLGQQYAKALDATLTRVRTAGDLNKTMAVMNEIKRFANEKRMPATPADLSDIQRLQAHYAKAASAYYSAKATMIVALAAKYDQVLERLQKNLVSSGELDDAKTVQEERRHVAASAPVVQAQLVLKQASASDTALGPSTPSREAAREEAKTEPRKEEAIALIYCDDDCEIYHNGNKKSFAHGKELEMTVQEGDVIAVKAWDTQGGTACGLLVGIRLVSSGKTMGTDRSWIYSPRQEEGWQEQDFDDKRWKHSQKSSLDWINKTADTAFRQWRIKPRPIWGKGSPVYFRKHISLNDFR